jgi:signal transduction histidine kinase
MGLYEGRHAPRAIFLGTAQNLNFLPGPSAAVREHSRKTLYFNTSACKLEVTLFRRLILPLLFAARLFAAEPLDTIAKIRALSPEEAKRGLPVQLDATVIYFDPREPCLFVKDDTACTYVAYLEHRKYSFMDLKPGMRVRIDGKTGGGDFFPTAIETQIEVLGNGPLPEPRKISVGELLSPALDSQWVEVPAMVTGVESGGFTFAIEIEVYGWKLKAQLPFKEHSAERAAALMQRPVLLQGVAATLFNSERQMTGRYFFVPSFDQIIPTDTLALGVTPPLRSINQLLQSDDTAQTLVRVAGIITQVDGNIFYLRDGSGSLRVYTAGKDGLVAGDRVEAEGFAAIAPYRPIFRARKVVVTGHEEIPRPMALEFEERQLPHFQAELVGLDAYFLARRDGVSNVVLQCRLGDRFFEADLPPGGVLPKDLAPGDYLRLTGICELTTTHPFPRVEWVDGFRLRLPKAGGVVILSHASWLTLEHLFVLFIVTLAVAFVALVWVALLRLRVKAQTEFIVGQREHAAVQDERQRIARELHDTVEQELTGLSMQLGDLSDEIMEIPDPVPEEVRQSIWLAQKTLRHCREEARNSILDLRGIELEKGGLPSALRELLPAAASKGGTEFQILLTGEPRALPGIVGSHLLRIAQEGVANAAHHAAASKITVALDYAARAVTLTIQDNGHGFDPAQPPPDGHFGLLGIQERANKMQAGLEIKSAPGEGTVIRVVVSN